MPIDPRIIASPGSYSGTAAQLSDLQRQLRAVGAGGTVIGVGSLHGSRIASGSITSGNISAGAITAGLISAGAILTGSLAADAVTAVNIAAEAIQTRNLAAGSVVANNIVAGSITAGLIEAGTIVANNIAAGAISTDLLAAGAVIGDKIVAGAVTATKINVATLEAVSASMGTLTAGLIRIGAVSGAKTAIGNGISTTAGLKDGIVLTDAGNVITFWADATTGNLTLKGAIQTGSTGLGNIAGQIDGNTAIVDNTITGPKLIVDAITAREVAASSITASELAANSVIAGKILAGTIQAVDIAAGAITSNKLTIGFGGGSNRLLNSNFNDGLSGRSTAATQWTLLDATGTIAVDPALPGGRALNAPSPTTAGVSPILASPYVLCSFWKFVSASLFMSSAVVRSRRVVVQFFTANLTFISEQAIPDTAETGWVRHQAKALAVPPTAIYVRVLGQFLAAQANDQMYWAAGQIEEGEIVSAWSLAPGEIPFNSVTTTSILPGSITTGLVEADFLTGKVITGAILRTAATNPKVQLDSGGLTALDANGSVLVRLAPSTGLSLTQGTANTNKLTWVTSGGAAVGEISAFPSGTSNSFQVGVPTVDTPNFKARFNASTSDVSSSASLEASKDGSFYAEVVATGNNAGYAAVNIACQGTGGYRPQKLIDSNGASDYLYKNNGYVEVGHANARMFIYRSTSVGNTLGSTAMLEIAGPNFSDVDRPRIGFLIPGIVRHQFHMTSTGEFQCVNDANNAHVSHRCFHLEPSDRRLKNNFVELVGATITSKIRAMGFYSFDWNDSPKKGIGPTAQDFHTAFPGLEGGSDDPDGPLDGIKGSMAYPISDAIGVCLAAIKELAEEVAALKAAVMVEST